MTDGNVKSFEKEAFKKKLLALAAAKTVDNEDFAEAVYQALTLGVSEDDFRDTFGLTKGAVERWTMGKNLPQPVVRTKILQWIVSNIWY